MSRTVLTTLALTGIACCAVLVAQASKNRTLREGIAAEEETVADLQRELRQIDPPTSLGDARRSLPIAPQQGSEVVEPAIAPQSKQSADRVERTRKNIDRLVADLGDMNRSPAEFFKVLPDILRIIQDLSLDEMMEVAQGIDAPNGMNEPNGKAIARMVLLMLAAEEDPLRVMQDEGVMADREIRPLISQLAKRDPDAAREWVKNSDLTTGEKEEFESFVTFNVMRSDVGAGLKLLREMKKSGAEDFRGYSRLSQMPMPAELIPDLVNAYKDPSNTDLRQEIGGMVLRTSMINGGVAATRETVAQLDMRPAELSNFFIRDLSDLIHAEHEVALGWMVEALDDEWEQRTLPIAISSWARKDFNAAGEYLGKMEASKTKDKAIKEFAGTVSGIDPEAAAIWALEISDEDLRKEAIRGATSQWRVKDQAAVKQWLEANGFDE